MQRLGLSLLNKMKVFILGANSDIGIEVCKKFILEGWDVIGAYRRPNKKMDDLVCDSIDGLKKIQLDLRELLRDEKILDSYSEDILDADSFINCASIYEPMSFNKITARNLMEHFQINVIPSILIEKKLITRMMRNKFGRILNISSIGVKYGGGSHSFGYSLSKHAIEFMPADFKKWAKNNVYINTLRVGVTNTKFHKLNKNKEIKDRVKMIPANRMAEPEEIARMIWSLASHENTYITGQVVTISGGE